MEEYASTGAVREYVGKRGGQKSMKQGEIDELLVRYCLQVSCHVNARLILEPMFAFDGMANR